MYFMRIAHLSDFHLLEPNASKRSHCDRVRLAYLSLLHPLGAAVRIARAKRALSSAIAQGFDHLVISGDLTEDGKPAQFEELARVLAESKIPRERITLVPGNHDAYEHGQAWASAMAGPLAPYAATSAGEPGATIDLGDIVLMPISTAVHQHWASSWGAIHDADFEQVERRCGDSTFRRRTLVLVQHHPPLPQRLAPIEWIDGLRGYKRLRALLARSDALQVLHGHLHKLVDRMLGIGPRLLSFGAPAVVEHDLPHVRFYMTRGGRLVPV